MERMSPKVRRDGLLRLPLRCHARGAADVRRLRPGAVRREVPTRAFCVTFAVSHDFRLGTRARFARHCWRALPCRTSAVHDTTFTLRYTTLKCRRDSRPVRGARQERASQFTEAGRGLSSYSVRRAPSAAGDDAVAPGVVRRCGRVLRRG